MANEHGTIRSVAVLEKGFTLVELVIVVILLGTLSAVSIGLFSSRSAFSPLIANQQLASAALLAQQAALAGNPGGSVRISQTADDFQYTVGPGSPAERTFSVPREGTSLSGAALPLTLAFNSDGMLNSGANINLTFSGDSTFETCISSLGAVYAGSCQP